MAQSREYLDSLFKPGLALCRDLEIGNYDGLRTDSGGPRITALRMDGGYRGWGWTTASIFEKGVDKKMACLWKGRPKSWKAVVELRRRARTASMPGSPTRPRKRELGYPARLLESGCHRQ